MTDELDIAERDPAPIADDILFRDEEGRLSRDWLAELSEHIEAGDKGEVEALMAPLHTSDTGDVLEALNHDERLALIHLLGDRFDFAALTEVDDHIRLTVMDELPNEQIVQGVLDLDSDDAVYILEDISAPDREEILAALPTFERLSLKRSFDFPEDSAGRRMQTEFIAIPPFWTVGQTIDYMREDEDLPVDFYQIYVVDPGYKLLGTIALDRILRSQRPETIEAIMNANVIEIEAEEDQEEAARVFERYDLIEVAVVDDNQRLVGVLTIDDIVDVINEEASEDIRRLGGVGDEEVSDNVWGTVKSRVTWLAANLVTAILASLVIGLFNGTIEQMVALAVLMPIVASMGGNAGTQTMTVTVRALATRDLDIHNARRLVTREILVGVVNGFTFAIIMGIVAAVWFANVDLGIVIGIAMVVNMLAAGLSGILIPIALEKLHVDPAIASSVFVTTVTDIVGFFAFLSLAAVWFGLL
ncbi:magnesium transporter [Cucumibacter marinus]|uniref:magnesium transporter n=1 Tax=Cucumibacter marinus TaxID=1121252 RepID=UPI0004125B65|nr:magnesium transporter [Cucumibacter marinus]